ncbi:hypothetical protein ACFYM3_35760 [Streptomyces massasporeus]|uniref:Uncharacterized protein n=1 Tax=Streptomyces massasporeus TaxID=67324 RepID=A0ABW6LN65_9ACTN
MARQRARYARTCSLMSNIRSKHRRGPATATLGQPVSGPYPVPGHEAA